MWKPALLSIYVMIATAGPPQSSPKDFQGLYMLSCLLWTKQQKKNKKRQWQYINGRSCVLHWLFPLNVSNPLKWHTHDGIDLPRGCEENKLCLRPNYFGTSDSPTRQKWLRTSKNLRIELIRNTGLDLKQKGQIKEKENAAVLWLTLSLLDVDTVLAHQIADLHTCVAITKPWHQHKHSGLNCQWWEGSIWRCWQVCHRGIMPTITPSIPAEPRIWFKMLPGNSRGASPHTIMSELQ